MVMGSMKMEVSDHIKCTSIRINTYIHNVLYVYYTYIVYNIVLFPPDRVCFVYSS